MKRKYILTLVIVVAVLAAGAGLWLHLRRGHSDYTGALPADCRALVCIDPWKMSEQACLVLSRVEDLCRINATACYGLSWDKPMYVFYTASGRIGALAAVADNIKLQIALENEKMEVTEQRGLQWAEKDGRFVVCFDEEKMMVLQMLSAQDKDQPRTELYDLMHQRGGAEIPFAEALGSVKGSLRMAGEWQTMAPLLDMADLPADEAKDFADVRLAAGCKFTKNSLDLQVKAYDPNHRLDSLQKLADGLLRPIGDGGLQSDPEGVALSVCANVDGTRLLETLRKNAQLGTALDVMKLNLDVDGLLGSIDGDVVLAVSSAGLPPKVALSARMKDTGFMQGVPSWGGMGMRVVRAAADSCVLSWMGTDIRIGTAGDVCTVSTFPLDEARGLTVGRDGEDVPEGSLLVCNVRPRLLKDMLGTVRKELLPERVRLVLHREGLDLNVAMSDSWMGLLERMMAKPRPKYVNPLGPCAPSR